MITIAICTYNRAEILKETLHHLLTEVKHISQLEVLIIDNNSKDETEEVVEEYIENYPIVHYVKEKEQGLSHARNRAIIEAQQEYILYLDDDALCEINLIVKLGNILKQNPNVKVLGGVYKPWYRFGKPKWFKDEYASSSFRQRGLHILPHNELLSGGVMLFHRSVFDTYGQFDTELGMKGEQTYYGEDSEIQERIRKKGGDIYGDDNLVIYHIVMKYKLHTQWFFKQKAALGRSLVDVRGKRGVLGVIKALGIASGLVLVYGVVNVFKLFSSSYYKENYLIDTFAKPVKWLNYAMYQL